MAETFKVSQSKMNCWQSCKMQYHLRYSRKLRRKKVVRPLQVGRIIHSMLEADANGDDAFEVLNQIGLENANLFRVEREEYGNIVEDIRVIMTEYFKHWPHNSLRFVRKKGRSAEHEFEVGLGDGLIITGKIDALAKANKLFWLVEHKTFTQLPSEDHRWRNLQSALYLRVIEMLGWGTPDGTLWDYIHTKPPSVPEILKSGEVSKKRCNTLPTALIRFFEEQGLSSADYPDLMERAQENRNHYFVRLFNPIQRDTVDLIYKEFVQGCFDMRDNHGKISSRSIGRHCDYCAYELICRAEFQGSDVDFVIQREYTNEKQREPHVHTGQAPHTARGQRE